MFFWKKRKTNNGKNEKLRTDLEIPRHFLCPISLQLMKDPVSLSSGITYDRESIEKWLDSGNFTCPVTNSVLRNLDQIPNHALRRMIQDWCVENRSHGVDRIPTPRIPVMSVEVHEALVGISDAVDRVDLSEGLRLVEKIEKWGRDSERNRSCIVSAGSARVLAAAFEAFAADSFERNSGILEEILAAIVWMVPVDEESEIYLASSASMTSIVRLLNRGGDLVVKRNAISLLRGLVSSETENFFLSESLAAVDGISETLFKLIETQISPSVTKSSLTVIFHLVSDTGSHQTIISDLVQMGLIPLLLETSIESDKSVCEKSLIVLDSLCESSEARAEAYRSSLTVPLLVKKIMRLPGEATAAAVSIIWKLCKYEKEYQERVLAEALEVGAFQKLLLLLQVGSAGDTKDKATELMKLLNPYRAAGLECIDSQDFKNLKRSF